MAGPPTDIEPSELWALLSSRERPYELVDFPQFDPSTGKAIAQVAMWPLKQGEIIVSKAEATKFARACIKEKFDAVERVEGYQQVFEDACASELLFRACRNPKNVQVAAFPNSQAVREKLSSDEMSVLISSYSMVQLKLGPIQAYLSDSEYEAWIERLKVGGSELPLALLSSEQRIGLIMYMVNQYVKSPTDSSSAGSPPVDPSENQPSETSS